MASGLEALQRIAKESQEARSTGDFQKVNWFKLEKSGDSKIVRFLQELDPSSKNFREDKGVLQVFSEHSDPANFRKKMKCTLEELGRCYGCEQYKGGPKPAKGTWKAKHRMYAFVFVKGEGEDGEGEVQIISQSTTSSSIFNGLIELAKDYDSITDRPVKIVRNGEGTSTTYMMMPKPEPSEPYDDWDKYELPDLEKTATRTIPYEEQAAFFNDGAVPAAAPEEEVASRGGWPSEEQTEGRVLSGW